jgi:hypothetical protein
VGDLSLPEGHDHLTSPKIGDIIDLMGLHIREILKCSSGLLNPYIPSHSFAKLDSYTQADDLSCPGYFVCSPSFKLAADGAPLLQTFIQLSNQIKSPLEIADQFARATVSIISKEYDKSNCKKLPIHISASTEAYVNIRRVVQSHAGKILYELDTFTKDATARIRRYLRNSFPEAIPHAQRELVDLYHKFLHCLSEVAEDKFPAELGAEPQSVFRSLLASHPILGGLRIFHSRLHLQSLALESSNVRQGVQIQAFLYLALLEGEISSPWQDMEFVLSQLKSEVVWGGKDRPRKGEDFSKRMRAVVNGKKHYMKQQTPTYMPLAEKKRPGHGYAQVSRLLLNRIISANDGAASLSFDDLELLLTYLDAEESEKEKLVEPLQDANGFFNNRPELWKNMEEMKRLSPVELLYSFSRHFAAELPGLMFDWLAYEDRLWELAGKLKKAFDVAGLKLG